MTKPTDATTPLEHTDPPKPASEELDEKELEQVSGGFQGLGIFKDEAAIKGE